MQNYYIAIDVRNFFMRNAFSIGCLCVIFAASCTQKTQTQMAQNIAAPVARKIPKILEKFGDKRTDDYYWLNDRENPEVIDYLKKENEYYQKKTAHTKKFQKELYEEMKARIKEDDQSVPYFYNGYFYITRYEKGKDYPIYSRKKGSLSAPEEILFNCNELAKGHAYFQLGGMSVSPDNRFASFGTDIVGRRIYTIQIKNLETGEILPDKIENTTGGAVWANDNQTLFYTRQDKITLRSDKIFKHRRGGDASDDVLIFDEKDDTFNVGVSKSKSRKYIVIESSSTLTTESQILEADNPDGKFRVFQKRRRELEYHISHFEDNFYITTNADKAENFKIMKTPETATAKKNWKDLIPHRDDVLIEGLEIFRNYLVVEERANGLNKIRIMPWNGKGEYYLPFKSETYTAYPSTM